MSEAPTCPPNLKPCPVCGSDNLEYRHPMIVCDVMPHEALFLPHHARPRFEQIRLCVDCLVATDFDMGNCLYKITDDKNRVKWAIEPDVEVDQ